MSEAKATPRPWKVGGHPYGDRVITYTYDNKDGLGPMNGFVCEMGPQENHPDIQRANAALIVEAVNNHDRLKEENERRTALEDLLKLIDDGVLVRNTDKDGNVMEFVRQGALIVEKLQAAQNALGRGEREG